MLDNNEYYKININILLIIFLYNHYFINKFKKIK